MTVVPVAVLVGAGVRGARRVARSRRGGRPRGWRRRAARRRSRGARAGCAAGSSRRSGRRLRSARAGRGRRGRRRAGGRGGGGGRARPRRRGRCAPGVCGSVGGCMRPDPGEAGRRSVAAARVAPRVRRPGLPDHRGGAAPDRTARATRRGLRRSDRVGRPARARGRGRLRCGARSCRSSARTRGSRRGRRLRPSRRCRGSTRRRRRGRRSRADAVGDAVDEHLGLLAAVLLVADAVRVGELVDERADLPVGGSGGDDDLAALGVAPAAGPVVGEVADLDACSRARRRERCSGAIRWWWLSPVIGCAGGASGTGSMPGSGSVIADVEDGHGAEEDALLAGLLAVLVALLDGDGGEDPDRLLALARRSG